MDRFFSQKDLGGVNPGEFHDNLKFANLKQQFLTCIQGEIDYLEGCIKTSSTGGWSTHLNDGMKKRIGELKDLHYRISVNNGK